MYPEIMSFRGITPFCLKPPLQLPESCKKRKIYAAEERRLTNKLKDLEEFPKKNDKKDVCC